MAENKSPIQITPDGEPLSLGYNPPPASAILRAVPTGERAEAGYNPPPPIVIRQNPQTPTPTTTAKPPATLSQSE